MPTLPWLPDLLQVSPWSGSTFDDLYSVFSNSIKGGRLTYRGNKIWHFPDLDDGREEIFWHLTSCKDKNTGDRLPDLRRCERLHWIPIILAACANSDVLEWDYAEGSGKINSYVWLKEENFVIILKKYPKGDRRILTSYYLDYTNSIQKMQRKYNERLK